MIKKTCECPHSYHTNTFSAYQPTHASNLSSTVVVSLYKNWSEQFHPKEIPLTTELKADLKKASNYNVLTKSNSTKNVRDLYRYKCRYGPCVIFQKDALSEDGNVARHYPDFSKLMENLSVMRSNSNSADTCRRVTGSDYLFLSGNIVIVNPVIIDKMPIADKWWLLQINKAHHSSKKRNCLSHLWILVRRA